MEKESINNKMSIKQICYPLMTRTHRQVLEQNTASLAGFLLRRIVFRHAYPKHQIYQSTRIMTVRVDVVNHEKEYWRLGYYKTMDRRI